MTVVKICPCSCLQCRLLHCSCVQSGACARYPFRACHQGSGIYRGQRICGPRFGEVFKILPGLANKGRCFSFFSSGFLRVNGGRIKQYFGPMHCCEHCGVQIMISCSPALTDQCRAAIGCQVIRICTGFLHMPLRLVRAAITTAPARAAFTVSHKQGAFLFST